MNDLCCVHTGNCTSVVDDIILVVGDNLHLYYVSTKENVYRGAHDGFCLFWTCLACLGRNIAFKEEKETIAN